MTSPTPKGEKRTAEDKISDLFDKYEVFLSADMFDEIHQAIKVAEDAARAEGYEACRSDLVAIQSAKWSKEAYEKGFADAVAKAAFVVQDHYWDSLTYAGEGARHGKFIAETILKLLPSEGGSK